MAVDKLLLVSMSPWITDWQVIGPFDLRWVDDPCPPEKEGFVAGASYDGGRAGKVSWHRVTAGWAGFVPVGETLNPADQATAYAFTRVFSPDTRETELLIGCADSIKAWLNGKVVWRNDVYRPGERDQDRARVTLRPGENTLLIKIKTAPGWGMFARFRDPLSELRFSAAP
jgi:hypothetical protein